jgi:hypothetical protein
VSNFLDAVTNRESSIIGKEEDKTYEIARQITEKSFKSKTLQSINDESEEEVD